MRRDDSLADRMVPARDVADSRQVETPRRCEDRDREVRLRVGEDNRLALTSHAAEQRRRHVSPRREMSPDHQRLDDSPPRERPDAIAVEEGDRVARRPALPVKSVAKTMSDSEWIETYASVQRHVDVTLDPFDEADLRGKELVLVQDLHLCHLLEPSPLVLSVHHEQYRELLRKGPAERSYDSALEEDATREQFGENEPDALSGGLSQRARRELFVQQRGRQASATIRRTLTNGAETLAQRSMESTIESATRSPARPSTSPTTSRATRRRSAASSLGSASARSMPATTSPKFSAR
jgi:hypothetical protein